jgi:hypothetical protein
MKIVAISTGIGLATLTGLAAAHAQPNPIQGTPSSLFPYAAPHEVQIINGVPAALFSLAAAIGFRWSAPNSGSSGY